MRITELHIDRFGVWQDLTLSVPATGVSVIYGPNEAGKTTLLRFIRGMLFGFTPGLRLLTDGEPAAASASAATPALGGSLRFVAAQTHGELRRQARSGAPDEITFTGASPHSADQMANLLGGCHETLFKHVFALGLHELQELATLEAGEVARHIYGMTLGPDARRLLDACERVEAARRALFDPASSTGRFAELLKRDRQLAEELHRIPALREQHRGLVSQRRQLASRIAELEKRQAGYHSQLRGHVFLERVYSPWKQVRDCEAELRRLPVVSAFPDGGLKRLDELEAELDSLRRIRNALRAEASGFREQRESISVNSQWTRHETTLQSLIEQQPWAEESARQAADAEARAASLHAEFDQARSALGDGWNDARVDGVDTTAAAHARLRQAARTYRSAKARWNLVRRRYDRLNKSTRQREADLAGRLGDDRVRGAAAALEATQAQLRDLEQLAEHRHREAELEQRGRGLSEQRRHVESQLELPRWVYPVLAAFGAFGVLFAVAGLVAGVTSSVISGAAYVLIGATCGISAWALKTHFERAAADRVEALDDDLRANEVALRETRQEIDRLSGGHRSSPAAAGDPSNQFDWEDDAATFWERRAPQSAADQAAASSPGEAAIGRTLSEDTVDEVQMPRILKTTAISTEDGRRSAADRPTDAEQAEYASSALAPAAAAADSERIRETLRRISELERLIELEQQVRIRRRRLTEFRSRLPAVQRQLSAARQTWCEAVRGAGLPEALEIADVLRTWRRVAQLHDVRNQLAAATVEHDRHQGAVEAYRRRVTHIGRQLHGPETACNDPVQCLLEWSEELEAHRQHQAERRRLRREERRRAREARQYETQIAAIDTRRSALLVQGGAASREEFEQRGDWVLRRRECHELRELAQAELDAAAGTEPDLAIVEEDLLAFDADENRESLEMINLELEDLERETRTACEELGRLKQEIHELETDRRPTEVRFERAQVETELVEAAQQWCAVAHASRVLDRMREVFERTCQPATLAAAARHLEALTGGRYHNIWTPLGQQRLSLDDAHGRTLTVEQLSGGTREQLFLAVRLATIEQLAASGVDLPIVLDDVLVNFDQARTEAAVDALLKFAADRQVLFFTCHLHLAQLFQGRGLEPRELPDYGGQTTSERRAA